MATAMIPLTEIIGSNYDGRDVDDDDGRAAVERLARDMRANGYDPACPIVVWYNAEIELYELQRGNHRVAAATLAGLIAVPALVLSEPLTAAQQLKDNLLRRNDSTGVIAPIAIAAADDGEDVTWLPERIEYYRAYVMLIELIRKYHDSHNHGASLGFNNEAAIALTQGLPTASQQRAFWREWERFMDYSPRRATSRFAIDCGIPAVREAIEKQRAKHNASTCVQESFFGDAEIDAVDCRFEFDRAVNARDRAILAERRARFQTLALDFSATELADMLIDVLSEQKPNTGIYTRRKGART